MVEVIKWSGQGWLMASIPFAVGITWHHPFWTERREVFFFFFSVERGEVVPVTVLLASSGGRCGTSKDLASVVLMFL